MRVSKNRLKQKDRCVAMELKCGVKRKIRPEVKRTGTLPERESEREKGERRRKLLPLPISMSLHAGSVWAPLQNQFKKLPFSQSSVIRIL